MHSWGPDSETPARWTPCCYTPDHSQASCMWNKPRELTSYAGDGYEISAGGYGSNADAIEGWYKSNGHRVVMLSEGSWSAIKGALGCSVHNRLYHCWFGRAKAADDICDNAPADAGGNSNAGTVVLVLFCIAAAAGGMLFLYKRGSFRNIKLPTLQTPASNPAACHQIEVKTSPPAVAVPKAATAPRLPAGWRRVKDDASGEYYYWNENTDATSWDPPK